VRWRAFLFLLLALVGLAEEVSLVRISQEAQVLPGAVAVHIWEVTNTSADSLSLKLSAEAPQAWEILGVPQELLLGPASSEYLFVTVLVPKTAVAGTYAVRLRVAWNGKEAVGEGPLKVQGVAALALSFPAPASAPPGETLTSEVFLLNRGNSVDRVTLEAWTAVGWPAKVTPQEVVLAPGEGKAVRVEVSVPFAAPPSREVVFLRARSGVEPSVEARIAWYITVLPPGPERILGTVLAELTMKAYGDFSLALFGGGRSSFLGVSGRGTVLGGSLDLDLRFSGPWAPSPYTLMDFSALYDRGNARAEAGRIGLAFSPLLSPLGFWGLLGRLSREEFSLSFGSGWEGESGRTGGVFLWRPDWGELGGAYREERAPAFHSQAGTLFVLFRLSREMGLRLEGGAGRIRGLTRFAALTQLSVEIPDLFFGELRLFSADPDFPGLFQDQMGFLLSGRLGGETGARFMVMLSRDNVRGFPFALRSGMQLAWDLGLEGWPFSLSLGADLRRARDVQTPPELDERSLRGEIAARFSGKDISLTARAIGQEYRDFVAGLARLSAEYQQRLDLKLTEALGAVLEFLERAVWDEAGLLSAGASAKLELFAGGFRAGFSYGKEGGTLRASLEWKPTPILTLRPAAEAAWDEEGKPQRFSFSFGFSYEFSWTPPFLPDKGWVSGRVFADLDGDGEEDPGEPGVAGAVLVLNGVRVSSGKDGKFKFPPLPPGNYVLRVESGPAGFGLPQAREVQVRLGQEVFVPVPLTPLASISGFVFQDLNANGVPDANEPGYARAMLRLVFPDGKEQEVLTDSAGRFFWPDLPPGAYRLEMLLESLPPRFEVTTEKALELRLQAGETKEVSFGVREKPRPVILIQPPLAEFTWSPRTPRANESVLFDGTPSQAFGAEIVSYVWDFDGDGVADAEGQRVTWTFPAAGLYLVELKVTDSLGLTGLVQYLVEVKP